MKITIKLFSIFSLTLCASLYGMDANKQPEAKPAPDGITALIEQRGKNASFQSRKEKLHTQRELADKFGYGQNQDLQEDMDAWWGKFDITIKYQQEFCLRSRSYEKDDSE